MPNEVISDEGQETVVREDTAKGFRWNKFIHWSLEPTWERLELRCWRR